MSRAYGLKKRKLCALALLLCVAMVVGMGCKRGRMGRDDGKLYVVATTGMLADAAKEVGGELVRVEGLMGPSVDPHLYKATTSDTHKLSQAGLILYNGLHLEGKMQDVLEKLSKFRPVVAVSDKLPHQLLRKPPEFKGFHDPHIWFDVSIWSRVVARVGEALGQVDAKHKKVYQARAEAYGKKLMALHKWTLAAISNIPKDRRFLVTSHDAFGYLGRAYGLQVVGLQGISTVAEAGVRDVERVIALLVRQKIPAIFSETSVSDKMIQAVIQGCTARKHEVKIGGKLFSDAMGAEGTPEGTYMGMVQHNVKTIAVGLGGTEPPPFRVVLPAKPRSAAKAPTAPKASKKHSSPGKTK